MAYPVSIPRFSFLLQKAIIAVDRAQEQYNYYYNLRRDETGKYKKGPSFSASAEKNAFSRLLRAQTNLKEMENHWNQKYTLWHNYEIKFDELETLFTESEIKGAVLTQKMFDIQTEMAITTGEKKIDLLAEFSKVCAEHDRVLRVREYVRGQIKKMSNNKPQQVPSLTDIKSTFTTTQNGNITQVVHGVDVKEVPDALKALQADIIRRNKCDHVHIPSTKPDPNDFAFDIKVKGENNDEKKKA